MRNNVPCMAPIIFNKIPNIIKDLDIVQFRKKLFKLLIDKCYYSVLEFMSDMSL